MEEEKQSIWHRNLNLAFVYVVVFLFGLVVVYAMTTVLNKKLVPAFLSLIHIVEKN